MTMTHTYLLTVPGNPSIKISQDELRSLLGEIEQQLHRSKVYRQAVASMEKLLGSSSEQAKTLFKTVSREAIGLAFLQFAQRNEIANINPETDAVSPDILPNSQEKSSDLSQCLTSVKLHSKAKANTNQSNLSSQSESVTNTAETVTNEESSSTKKTPKAWLKRQKKVSKAEIAKQEAAEKRAEILRQIGQQLREAREYQNLSLSQLGVSTHVQIHYMEAIENGNLESLPEDVFVRGYIRVMANSLGLNGIVLAASLPAPDGVKTVLPSSYFPKSNLTSGLAIRPVHLYLGYTALVAGAVGGLSLISEQANADKATNHNAILPSPSPKESLEQKQPTAKPGLKSSSSGVTVGADIAPPEAL